MGNHCGNVEKLFRKVVDMCKTIQLKIYTKILTKKLNQYRIALLKNNKKLFYINSPVNVFLKLKVIKIHV